MSIEAYKASYIIGIMLKKLKCPKNQQTEGPTTSEVFAQLGEDNLKPEHSAAMTLGMLSGGLSPNSATIFNTIAQSPGGTRYANIDMSMGDSSASTGLTPNFQIDQSNPFASLNSVSLPFLVFGNTGNGAGIMDMPANLDWVGHSETS